MSEIIVGLVAGISGVIIATISARKDRPSKLRDIVETSGTLNARLLGEIERLDDEVAEARAEADGARVEARAARDAETVLRRRVSALEEALRKAGIDPATVNGYPH